jgi:O-antigen/teichoic acid export membrane protein
MTPGPADLGPTYADIRHRAQSGAWAIVGRYVAVGLVSLAGSAVLIRSLGAERWATYSVAYFLLVYLEQLFSSRLLGKLVHTAERPHREQVATAIALMHVVGLAVLALFLALAILARGRTALPDLDWSLVAVGFGSYLYAGRATSVALLERDLAYRPIAIAEVCDHLFFYILAVTLAFAGLDLGGVLIALALRGIPSLLVLRIRAPTPLLGRWHRAEAASLLAFAVAGMGTGLVTLLEGLVPAVLLAAHHPVELAFTITSANIVGYAAVAQFVVQRLGFPGLARLKEAPQAFWRVTQSAYDTSCFILVSMVTPVAAFAHVWMPALFGQEWERAAPVLIAIATAMMCNGPLYVLSGSLLALGRPATAFRLHLGMFAAFALSASVGVRVSPLLGAAVAYALSRVGGLVAAWHLLRRHGISLHVMEGAMMLAAGVGYSVAVATLLSSQEWLAVAGTTLAALIVWLWILSRNRARLRGLMRIKAGV